MNTYLNDSNKGLLFILIGFLSFSFLFTRAVAAQQSLQLASNGRIVIDSDGDGLNNAVDADIDDDGADNDNDDDVDGDGSPNSSDKDDDDDGVDDKDDNDDDNDGTDDKDDDDNQPSGAPTTNPTQNPTGTVTGTGTPSPTNPIPTGTANGLGFQYLPITQATAVGGTLTLAVMINTLTTQSVGAEAQVRFDNTFLRLKTITVADFFPTITSADVTGGLLVRGIVEQPADYRTGQGRMATLDFEVLKAGSTTLTFYCDPAVFNSSKIIKNDINASNVIDCAANNTYTVTIGAAAAPIVSSTPAASAGLPSAFNKNAAIIAVTALVLLVVSVVLVNV